MKMNLSSVVFDERQVISVPDERLVRSGDPLGIDLQRMDRSDDETFLWEKLYFAQLR